jgi:hypothetical protein
MPTFQHSLDINNFHLQNIWPADPIGGAAITIPLPVDTRVEIQSIGFRLITDATVVNRWVTIYVTTALGSSWQIHAPFAQTASLNRTYHFMRGPLTIDPAGLHASNQMVSLGCGNIIHAPLALFVAADALVAGDHLSNCCVWLRVWRATQPV